MHCQPPLHLPYTYVLNEQLYLTKHDKQNYRILILPRPLQMKMPPPNCSAFKPKSLLSAFGMTTHPQTHTSSCSLAHVTTSYLVHLVTLNRTVCFCPCSIQLTLNTARGTLLTWGHPLALSGIHILWCELVSQFHPRLKYPWMYLSHL